MHRIVKDNNTAGYDINPSNIDDLRRIADCRLEKLTDSANNEL